MVYIVLQGNKTNYKQGRGRARQEESTFVVMDEREDRTVAHLSAAEKAQRSLLVKFNALTAERTIKLI